MNKTHRFVLFRPEVLGDLISGGNLLCHSAIQVVVFLKIAHDDNTKAHAYTHPNNKEP